jgi:hypothetical protein
VTAVFTNSGLALALSATGGADGGAAAIFANSGLALAVSAAGCTGGGVAAVFTNSSLALAVSAAGGADGGAAAVFTNSALELSFSLAGGGAVAVLPENWGFGSGSTTKSAGGKLASTILMASQSRIPSYLAKSVGDTNPSTRYCRTCFSENGPIWTPASRI